MIHCFEYLARGLYCLLKLLWCDQKADVGRYAIFPRQRLQARARRPPSPQLLQLLEEQKREGSVVAQPQKIRRETLPVR
jgi:hypothetical protein